MKKLTSPQRLQALMLSLKKKGKTIAFVPTMGFLHAGHLRLMAMARQKADVVVASIFVNPLQFGPQEDFSIYPRDLKADLKKLSSQAVDYVFLPKASDLYPKNFQTTVQLPLLSQDLCGLARPGHFTGVATVVLKLFHIVQPDIAIFGKKDYQQYLLICQMVRDLNLPIRIVGAPLVREKDGLAMSSRNVRLKPEERELALSLSRALFIAKKQVKKSMSSAALINVVRSEFVKNPAFQEEYVAIRDSETLAKLYHYEPRKTLIAVAVQVGKVRLIDNIVI